MTSRGDIEQQTYKMIDDLKAVCTNYGLGNSGNEYKIITEAFLYKFLNDKFFYEVRNAEPKYKGMKTAEIEGSSPVSVGENLVSTVSQAA